MWSHQENVFVIHILVKYTSADDQVLEHEFSSLLFLLQHLVFPGLCLFGGIILELITINTSFLFIEVLTAGDDSFEDFHFSLGMDQHGVAGCDEGIEFLNMLSSGWLGEQSSTVIEVAFGIGQSIKEIFNGF